MTGSEVTTPAAPVSAGDSWAGRRTCDVTVAAPAPQPPLNCFATTLGEMPAAIAARTSTEAVGPDVLLKISWTDAGTGTMVRRPAGTDASNSASVFAPGSSQSACTSPRENAPIKSDGSPRRSTTVAGPGGVPQYLSLRANRIWPVTGS